MANYIKGGAIANATSYELHEKVGSNYNLLDTKNEINFNLDELSFEAGDHVLVVKARADGYKDSDFSNEVVYTLEMGTTVRRAIPLLASPGSYTKASSTFGSEKYRSITYGNVKAGDTLEIINPDDSFENQLLVYKVSPKDTPVFYDGKTRSESYVSDLRGSYAAENYTFEEDCRFLAVMKDNKNNTTRDYTKYAPFCLYQLSREYTIGEAAPIQAYHGSYNTSTGDFEYSTTIRAIAVLDLKTGDVIQTASDDLKLNLIILEDKSYVYRETRVTGFTTNSWTSDADQRVLVLAANANATNNAITKDLGSIFKVIFNS